MHKIKAAFVLVASLLFSMVPVAAPLAHAESGGIDMWVVNPLKTVYRTSTLPSDPQDNISIVSAKNEYESSQIVVRNDAEFDITKVEFSDLVSSGKDTLSKDNLSYHFEEYELKDTVQPNVFYPERVGNLIYPPSDIPDPLSNEISIHVAANSTQPIFVTNYVPSSAVPGVYNGSIKVKTTLGDYSVPIQVDVENVEIPKITNANFVNYQWTMTNGFTWDNYDVGKYYYGLETYSDEWFKLMDNFAKVMADHRQNMVWIRTDLFLNATGTKYSDFNDGIPQHIDWSLFDRYVQSFIDRGITNFANIHLIGALNQIMPSEEKQDAWKTDLPDALPKTDAFLEHYLTALSDHLKAKGWLDGGFTWYQHIRDEPTTDKDRNYWTYVARKVKQVAPKFKTMDADPNGVLLADGTKPYVDVWVPLTPAFQEKKSLYQAEQAAGKTLWEYTCEVNTPPWLNRFWTQPTLTGRLLFWNLSQDGVTGHLHWAWNAWYVGNWHGDSTIVYPDKNRQTVKSSLRYEAQRDGLEDYELMYKIKQTNPGLAKKIADSAVSPDDPRKYTLDPAYIMTLHQYLVKAAAGAAIGEIPSSTSPYEGQDIPMTYMVDSANGDIRYAGEWFSKSSQYAYSKSVQATASKNDSLEYDFVGSGIDVIVEKNQASGKVNISVDNASPVIVDLYEKVQHDYFTIYSKQNLSEGDRHIIKITNLEGKEISFDAFRVHRYTGQQIYDASLKSLELTNAPKFEFNNNITNYRIMLPDSVNTLSLTPKQTDEAGSLLINGKRMVRGATVIANIPTGKSTITLQSTASDGVTTKSYTLSFVKGVKNEPGTNIARSYSDITATLTRPLDQGGDTYGPAKMVDGSYGTMFASWQGYYDDHPFPHEFVISWDNKQSFNTIVMATPSGLIQGINDIDVLVSKDGVNYQTVAQRVPITWTSNKDDGVMELTFANIPAVSDVTKLKIQINNAYNATWRMYAVYELELYNLPENEVAFEGLGNQIQASAGPNGTISPSGKVTVNDGDNKSFTFVPNTGYSVDKVTVDSIEVTVTGNVYTFDKVTSSHTINVTFKADGTGSNKIQASAGPNGTINPSGDVVVNVGDNKAFTFLPNTGYQVDKVKVDNTEVTVSSNVYTFDKVTSSHTINVTFKPSGTSTGNTNLIHASAGPNGTINPSGDIVVNAGDNKAFTFLPNTGYQIDKLTVDSKEVTITENVYSFDKVTSSHTINVTFKASGTGGGVSYSSDPVKEPTDKYLVKPEEFTTSAGAGKVTIAIGADIKQVVLPSNVVELLAANQLVFQTDQLSITVPVEVLKQLVDKIPADEQKDSHIALNLNQLPRSEANVLLAKAHVTGQTKVTLVGDLVDLSLVMIRKDGLTTSVPKFNQPVMVRLKVDKTANPNLSGVYFIAENGSLEYVDGTYDNGEIVAAIPHFSKYAVLEVKKSFLDVPSSHWALSVIQELVNKGVLNGVTEDSFEPNRAVTRAEFTSMLVRGLKLSAKGERLFSDVASDAWYSDAVAIAYHSGIVTGKSESLFDPNAQITRQEMVAMMMRGYKLTKPNQANGNKASSFTDESDVAPWALESVREAAALQLIDGVEHNKFVPNRVATRAEAAMMLKRVLQ
ncbi:glycoside hydrolase domain-containing protein [Paenibacillus sp. Soil787]|uniref:glycoside hydrolase domain-containing protein n=1 Tax=Paenibacillus sp. Soil787 TaxID=1736411 RepID=UPI000702EB65|nr:glycoside hydrolase domain-containing protein [Paenibacillus sp. Soil787]KRF09832.1 hypothetical protein ASG93_18495 [Paenibacillus sp. Soil787]